MAFNTKDTEKCLHNQIDPGVRFGCQLLLTEFESIQIHSHDGEEAFILRLSFWCICTLPLVFVHRQEYSPLWAIGKSRRYGRAVEALLQCRNINASCKFIDCTICCQRCVSKPVAHHDSIVAESKLIEPVNDYLCTSRYHSIGFFFCNHNRIGIKLNIDNDGVSIIQFPIQPIAIAMSEISSDDNACCLISIDANLTITKCQHHIIGVTQISVAEKSSNHVPNHVSNHKRVFVIYVISIRYNATFGSANHVSNHAVNHDRAKMTSFCPHLSTEVTTRNGRVISVIPTTYICVIFRPNHVINHDRLKNGGGKMKVTTQVTTMGCLLIFVISITYIGVILSANHASNHGATPKWLPEMTYSSILYIIILEIITLVSTKKS